MFCNVTKLKSFARKYFVVFIEIPIFGVNNKLFQFDGTKQIDIKIREF
jgi:hypothetical protein